MAEFEPHRQVWVGCPLDGLPVGMVIASVREGAVYIEEMDVLPAHGRRGLGARLLACVCAWAQAQGNAAVTLSTFRDVPWNGPFYRKHSFRDLQPAEWTPGMRAIREQEVQHGLRVEARVFMRRELDGVKGLPPVSPVQLAAHEHPRLDAEAVLHLLLPDRPHARRPLRRLQVPEAVLSVERPTPRHVAEGRRE